MIPADSKEIALYFLDLTQDKFTPAIVARNVKQARALLEAGYTKEEIIRVIDAVLKVNDSVYSFGYISASINDVLRKLNEFEKREAVEKQREEMRTQNALTIQESRSEVSPDESTERNREKARRVSVQSKFGRKYDFEIFDNE